MNKASKFLVNKIISMEFIPLKLRSKLYCKNGLNVKKAIIKGNCYFNSDKINIGNSFVNRDCKFYSSRRDKEGGQITIGDGVAIGFGAMLCCISHEIGDSDRRAIGHIDKDIVIENGCWIGANSVILPGVTIGKGCVIGAGSIVTKSCEPNGLYAGNPAKRIKDLD